MAKLYGSMGEKVFDKESLQEALLGEGYSQEWINSNQELINSMLNTESLEATRELITAMHENTEANKRQNELLTAADLANNEKV
jgi:hypothetical protein